ncbi:carD-like/TRCF domain protein, partial [Chlamydia psittaci 06-1683]
HNHSSKSALRNFHPTYGRVTDKYCCSFALF